MMRFQRRQRTTFSRQQLEAMKAAFEQNHYPEALFRDQLSKAINLDPMRIQVWFQNQRAKDRKRRGLMGSLDDSSPSPPPPQHQVVAPQIQSIRQDQQHLRQQQLNHQSAHHQHPTVTLARLDGSLMGGQQASFFRPGQEEVKVSAASRAPSPDQRPRLAVCVFNSETANEAALAVSEGEFDSIVDYHRNKYGNHHDHQQVVFLNSNKHSQQCSSPTTSSMASPQSSSRSQQSPIDSTQPQPQPQPRTHQLPLLNTPGSPSRQPTGHHRDEQEHPLSGNPHTPLIDNNNNRSLHHPYYARMVQNI